MTNDEQISNLPTIELRHLLTDPDPTGERPRRNLQDRNDPLATQELDDWLLSAAMPSVESQAAIQLEHEIHNTDRTVGARLCGEIAKRYGDLGLPDGTIRVTLTGSAGQSFGAFCINGVHLTLIGEANDYVGKGMAGGEIILRLPPTAGYPSQENFIAGNTLLYGATGGTFLAAGRVGERFAVRNCGSNAVVEGAGDHGCEYMTSGMVAVLGPVGKNFGAGMTGGVAYVYDREETLPQRLNPQLVRAERLGDKSDSGSLKGLIERHAEATQSEWSKQLLANWDKTKNSFWKVSSK